MGELRQVAALLLERQREQQLAHAQALENVHALERATLREQRAELVAAQAMDRQSLDELAKRVLVAVGQDGGDHHSGDQHDSETPVQYYIGDNIEKQYEFKFGQMVELAPLLSQLARTYLPSPGLYRVKQNSHAWGVGAGISRRTAPRRS